MMNDTNGVYHASDDDRKRSNKQEEGAQAGRLDLDQREMIFRNELRNTDIHSARGMDVVREVQHMLQPQALGIGRANDSLLNAVRYTHIDLSRATTASPQIPSGAGALAGERLHEIGRIKLEGIKEALIRQRKYDLFPFPSDEQPRKEEQSSNPVIPCRARGMPREHNYKTAYFEIPDNTEHGAKLKCSFEACRRGGVKFRYCTGCKDAIGRRHWRKGHQHHSNPRGSTHRRHAAEASAMRRPPQQHYNKMPRRPSSQSEQTSESSQYVNNWCLPVGKQLPEQPKPVQSTVFPPTVTSITSSARKRPSLKSFATPAASTHETSPSGISTTYLKTLLPQRFEHGTTTNVGQNSTEDASSTNQLHQRRQDQQQEGEEETESEPTRSRRIAWANLLASRPGNGASLSNWISQVLEVSDF